MYVGEYDIGIYMYMFLYMYVLYYYKNVRHFPVALPSSGEGEDKFGDRTRKTRNSCQEFVGRPVATRGGGTERGGACFGGVASESQGKKKGDKVVHLSYVNCIFLREKE